MSPRRRRTPEPQPKKRTVELRVRTWVQQDQKGWYCYVGFWEGAGAPDRDADTWMRVGPWPTHAEADAELKGDFRNIVKAATTEYTKSRGGIMFDARVEMPESV